MGNRILPPIVGDGTNRRVAEGLGGTLVQDIPTEVASAVPHEVRELDSPSRTMSG